MAALGRLMARFFAIFERLEPTSKNGEFSNHSKNAKMAESIDHGTPRGGFLIKKHDFGTPFLHRFFDFCQKWRKCEISEEYNAKRGSEPSKSIDFSTDFS